VSLLTFLFTEVIDGRNAHLTDDSSAPWAASPATSRTTRAMLPPPAYGTPGTESEEV
jgi:hypothetical protein